MWAEHQRRRRRRRRFRGMRAHGRLVARRAGLCDHKRGSAQISVPPVFRLSPMNRSWFSIAGSILLSLSSGSGFLGSSLLLLFRRVETDSQGLACVWIFSLGDPIPGDRSDRRLRLLLVRQSKPGRMQQQPRATFLSPNCYCHSSVTLWIERLRSSAGMGASDFDFTQKTRPPIPVGCIDLFTDRLSST